MCAENYNSKRPGSCALKRVFAGCGDFQMRAVLPGLLPGREITARFYQAAWDMELLEETAAQGEEDDHAFAK